MTTPNYQSGDVTNLPFVVTMALDISIDPDRHYLIARWVEFWCDTNCDHAWNIFEYDTTIQVGFHSEYEAAMFKLSPEYTLT